MSKENKHIYTLELTERQAQLLSYACDNFSRLICGQDRSYQDLFEQAWEKRCKEATGNFMDKEFEGGWNNMRSDAEELCKTIKKRFWGLDYCSLYGIHYDDTADILFDIHQCIRHQLWLDRPADKKSNITVDADEAMQFGTEPLAVIKRIKDKRSTNELKKDIEKLYSDIDKSVSKLIETRARHDDAAVANCQHKIESLLISAQQELKVIHKYLSDN